MLLPSLCAIRRATSRLEESSLPFLRSSFEGGKGEEAKSSSSVVGSLEVVVASLIFSFFPSLVAWCCCLPNVMLPSKEERASEPCLLDLLVSAAVSCSSPGCPEERERHATATAIAAHTHARVEIKPRQRCLSHTKSSLITRGDGRG
jgi:hypothetical protein